MSARARLRRDHGPRDPRPKDANFGRPSMRRVILAVGTPFSFKLKAPHDALAGVGFFAGFSVLPDFDRPRRAGTDRLVRNGLALRSDLHRRFDLGYVTVDPDHRFVVSRRLADDFGSGRSYRSFHGQPIALPADVGGRPAGAALAWHRDRRYFG
jgi:putative restriction endonuclease